MQLSGQQCTTANVANAIIVFVTTGRQSAKTNHSPFTLILLEVRINEMSKNLTQQGSSVGKVAVWK